MFLRPRNRRLAIVLWVFGVLGILFAMAMLMLYASKTDAPELMIFAKKLLPAGHCLCQSSTTFACTSCLDCAAAGDPISSVFNETAEQEKGWEFTLERDGRDLGLGTQQCDAAFPGLFEDINRAVRLRASDPIRPGEIVPMELADGMVHAMIFKRELYIIGVHFKHMDHRKKGLAALHAMQRAILATPHFRDLPNIEFIISVEDMVWNPNQPIWVLSRRAHDEHLWLMPDFGYWSWNVASVGSFTSVVGDIVDRETQESWEDKERKLVWRGKPSYAPKLRRALIDAAKDKPWSAVSGLQWSDQQSFNNDFMGPADQCSYMFIAHAEGRSYSGSLKYRQLCRSVIVSHKLQWIQHHHYLLVASGADQNYVEVERDFSDLDAAMEDLLANPEKAKRIADNNVRTFRERYLTPAAEACYWRALIDGWAQVSFGPELYEAAESLRGGRKRRGIRFESFAIMDDWEQLSYP